MQDRSTRLGRRDGLFGDLVGRERQALGHGGRVDRAGDGAADDDFFCLFHVKEPERVI